MVIEIRILTRNNLALSTIAIRTGRLEDDRSALPGRRDCFYFDNIETLFFIFTFLFVIKNFTLGIEHF